MDVGITVSSSVITCILVDYTRLLDTASLQEQKNRGEQIKKQGPYVKQII